MFFKNDSDRGGKPTAERGVVPLLPLRDIIVFPHMVSQLFVGRERSIAALDEAMNRGKEIFLAAQRNAKTNDPTPEDIFLIGSVGVIMQLLRLPDGTVKVLVEGQARAGITKFTRGALVSVARQALERSSGARGLRAILENAMLDIMYDVPSRTGIKEVVVSEDVILKHEPPLIVYAKEAELA